MIERIIYLFDDKIEKVSDFEDGIKKLKSFGIICDLMDRDSSFYIKNGIFLKPNYYQHDEFCNHKGTEYKVDDGYAGSLYAVGTGRSGELGLGQDAEKRQHHLYWRPSIKEIYYKIYVRSGIIIIYK